MTSPWPGDAPVDKLVPAGTSITEDGLTASSDRIVWQLKLTLRGWRGFVGRQGRTALHCSGAEIRTARGPSARKELG